MTYRYRATWQQEDLMEFALSHTVRYRDPLNKKRFAIPYKDAQKAADKMAQLKRDGVKEIEITKDILRGKFKEDLDENLRYSVKFSMKKGGEIKNAFYNDKEAAEKFKNDIIKKGGKAIMTTEADLTKGQIKKVHKMADKLPKKDFIQRYGKDGDSVRYAVATNIIKKKQGIGEMKTDNKDHPAKNVYEQIKGLKNKAEKSGMPYSILKKVYDRGMAAWRGGHRPGTSQQQWAFARVNSFVTKSSGTWGGADKDLAKQVRGSK